MLALAARLKRGDTCESWCETITAFPVKRGQPCGEPCASRLGQSRPVGCPAVRGVYGGAESPSPRL